jgi:hypothetical protein
MTWMRFSAPTGSVHQVGASSGRRVVARLPRDDRGHDHWVGAVPAGPSSPGENAPDDHDALATRPPPGGPGRTTSRGIAVPPAFFDAPGLRVLPRASLPT